MQRTSDTSTPVRTGVTVRDTGGFGAWLQEQESSVLLCLREDNRFLAVGERLGQVAVSSAVFDRPSAVAVGAGGVVLATRHQLWTIPNALEAGGKYRQHDGLFLPRLARTLGQIAVADLSLDGEGRARFVSSLYDCLGHPAEERSFDVTWMPPFISSLVPENRCHLTGLALREGDSAFVSACARSDVARGWRSELRSGGVILEVETGAEIVKGLSLPFTPRWHRDSLWFLEAGRGSLVRWSGGDVERVAELPGFARALEMVGDHALVATSRLRPGTRSSLPLGDRLEDDDSRCGVWLVDTRTGNIEAGVECVGADEIHGLALLNGHRMPWLVGLSSREWRSAVTVGFDGDVLRHHVGAVDELAVDPISAEELQETTDEGPAQTDARALARERARRAASQLEGQRTGESSETAHQVKQQRPRIWRETAERFIEQARGMLYPSLELQVRSRHAEGPLVGTALVDEAQRPVALAVSTLRPSGGQAEVLSFWVRPDLRRRGLGSHLLEATTEALRDAGAATVGLLLRADWHDTAVMERLVQRAGFDAPQPRQIAYRNDLEYFVRSGEEMAPLYPVPDGFEIVRWVDVTEEQRLQIERRQEEALRSRGRGWYPPALNPFQLEDSEFPQGPSRALAHHGRIVGWMLCHEIKPDTMQYTALFIDPDLREGYLAGELIKRTFERHHAVYVESQGARWRYSTFLTDARNQPIRHMIDVYFRPFNPEVTELRWTSKELAAAN